MHLLRNQASTGRGRSSSLWVLPQRVPRSILSYFTLSPLFLAIAKGLPRSDQQSTITAHELSPSGVHLFGIIAPSYHHLLFLSLLFKFIRITSFVLFLFSIRLSTQEARNPVLLPSINKTSVHPFQHDILKYPKARAPCLYLKLA